MEKQTVTIEPGFEAAEEYDDAGWTKENNAVVDAVGGMIAAGATSKEIAQAVSNGLESYA